MLPSRPRRLPRSACLLTRSLALASLLTLVAEPATLSAQQTPAWTQFQGGPEHHGSAPDGPGPALAESWALEEPLGGATGNEGVSGAAVAGGLAVIVAPEAVIAVDASTGAEAWQIDRAGGPTVQPAIATGGDAPLVVFPEGYGPNPPVPPSSAPSEPSPSPSVPPSPSPPDSVTPADGAENDTPSGVELVAVSLADGSEVWRVDLPSPSRSGVTASGDAVFVGGNDGSVTAVDASSGDIRWTEAAGATVMSPVAVHEDLVLASALGDDEQPFALVALGADDGAEAWRYEPGAIVSFGTAVAVADGVAFVACDDRTVRAVDVATGDERWLARTNAIVAASPAIVDELVVGVDVGGQVYALDRASGERRWDHALDVGLFAVRSPAVVTGGAVLVPTVRGELYALELTSGDLVWSADQADGLLRSLAVAGEVVLAVRSGSMPGLVAFEHDAAQALVRVQSPTIFEPAEFAGNAAIALIPLVAALLLVGRLLRGRIGPLEPRGPLPRDPIEDAVDGGNAP